MPRDFLSIPDISSPRAESPFSEVESCNGLKTSKTKPLSSFSKRPEKPIIRLQSLKKLKDSAKRLIMKESKGPENFSSFCTKSNYERLNTPDLKSNHLPYF